MDGIELLATICGIGRLRDVPAVAVAAHAFERRTRETSGRRAVSRHRRSSMHRTMQGPTDEVRG
jgi:CheY-like chemotaxis protein